MLLTTATTASADEYVATKSTVVWLRSAGGVAGPCHILIWIGRRATGTIEATTTASCPATVLYLEAQITIHARDVLEIGPERYAGRNNERAISVGHTERGGPGWCALGGGVHGSAGNPFAGSAYKAVGTVCV